MLVKICLARVTKHFLQKPTKEKFHVQLKIQISEIIQTLNTFLNVCVPQIKIHDADS